MSSYTVNPGYFINTNPNPWINYSKSQGGVTVTITQNGNIQICWGDQRGGHTFVHYAKAPSWSSKYAFIGTSKYILILDSSTGAGSITHIVSIINFDLVTERQVIMGTAINSSVQPPNIQYSQGTGTAFLIFNSTGSDFENVGDASIASP